MSDIFNEYAKKAIEQGLIKEASEVSDETNQRFDSLSDDDIRSLYDVKPNGEEKHILDQAHPESVYVAPAYDKMNGLVENLFERQDIIAWIATKPNDGKHTQKRYVKANQDLTMALLNTAFLLDRTGDNELMKLADSCAERLTKQAIAPLVIAGLAVAALAVVGLVNNFGGMVDSGVLVNCERTIEELNDLIDENELPGKEDDIRSLITDIEYVKSQNEELLSFNIDVGEGESTVKAEIERGKDLLKNYTKGVQLLSKRIDYIMSTAKAQEESGGAPDWWTRNLGDWAVSVKKLWYTWWGSDIGDALTALDTLKDSLSKSISSMTKLYGSIKAKAKAGDQESLEELLKVKAEKPAEETEEEEAAGSAMKQKKEEKESELLQFMPGLIDNE